MIKIKKLRSHLIAPIIASLAICFIFFPDVVFYFDRIEGEAELTNIEHNDFSLKYYHNVMNDTINLSGSVKDQRKLYSFKTGDILPIEYSKNYSNRIFIISVNPKSWIGGITLFSIGFVCLFSCALKLYS
jgi:hypothetical protein